MMTGVSVIVSVKRERQKTERNCLSQYIRNRIRRQDRSGNLAVDRKRET